MQAIRSLSNPEKEKSSPMSLTRKPVFMMESIRAGILLFLSFCLSLTDLIHWKENISSYVIEKNRPQKFFESIERKITQSTITYTR